MSSEEPRARNTNESADMKILQVVPKPGTNSKLKAIPFVTASRKGDNP